jgi:hypothetical protein
MAEPHPWTPADRQACDELLVGFCTGIDAGRVAEVTALFTEDCAVRLGGPDLHGRAELAAALAARPGGRRTLHLSTNAAIRPDAGGATATSVVLAFVLRDEQGLADPIPRRISAVRDRLVRSGAGWLIARRRATDLLPPDPQE